MTTTVYLIRHGQSIGNAKDIFQGRTYDTGLTELGIEQAEKTKEKMQGKQIDVVFCSPLKRCSETAEIIFNEKYITDEKITERGAGEWESLPKPEIKKRWPEEWKMYRDKREIPEGIKGRETMEQLEERIREFFSELLKKYSGKKVALVCHGGVEKGIISIILGLSREMIDKITVANSSVFTVEFEDNILEKGKILNEQDLYGGDGDG